MNRPFNKPAVAAVLSAAALLAAPAVWLARAESAQARGPSAAAQAPAGDRADAKPDRRVPPPPGGPGAPRQFPFDQRPVSPGEWADIAGFMGQHMPWRIAEVEQMPEGPAKERVKRLLRARYRGLRAVQSRDAESFEARLGQLKIEDQIYRLVSEMAGADDQRRQQIRDELRPQVTDLVDVDLRERQRRVDRLELELARQKKLLDHDTKDHDNIIERRLGRFLDWGSHWPGQRGNGNGAGNTPGVNAKPETRPDGPQLSVRPKGVPPRGNSEGDPSPELDKDK